MKVNFFIFVIYLFNLIINATGSFRNGPNICTNKQDCAYSRYDAMFPPHHLDRPLKNSRVYKKLLNDREIRPMKNKPQKLPTIEEINNYVNSVHKTYNGTGTSTIDLISILRRYHQNSKAHDHDSKTEDDDYINSKTKQIDEIQKKTDSDIIAKDDDLIAETLFGTTLARYDYNNSISKPEQLRDDMMNYVSPEPVILSKDNFHSFFHDIQSIKNKYIFSDMTYRKLHMNSEPEDIISDEIITPKNEINEHRNDKSEKLYRKPQTDSGIRQDDKFDDTKTPKYEMNEYRNDKTEKQYYINDLEGENHFQEQNGDNSQTTVKITTIPRKKLEKSRDIIVINATKKYDLKIMNGRKKYQKHPSEITRSTSKKSKLNPHLDVDYRKHSIDAINDDVKPENDNYNSTASDEPEKTKLTPSREQKRTSIPKHTKPELDFGDLVQTDAPDMDSELSNTIRKNGVIDFDLVRKIVTEKKYKANYLKKNNKPIKSVTERTDKYENTRPTIDLHYSNIIPRRDSKTRMRNIEHRPMKSDHGSDTNKNGMNDDYRPQYDLVRRKNPNENNAYQREIKQTNKIYNEEIEETKKTRKVKDLRETDTDFLKTIFLKPIDNDDEFDIKQEEINN